MKVRPGVRPSEPPCSECCVGVGDDEHEAYTAIVWSGILSHEKFNVAEAEAVENVEGNMLCWLCYRILAQECWPILAHPPSLNLRSP